MTSKVRAWDLRRRLLRFLVALAVGVAVALVVGALTDPPSWVVPVVGGGVTGVVSSLLAARNAKELIGLRPDDEPR